MGTLKITTKRAGRNNCGGEQTNILADDFVVGTIVDLGLESGNVVVEIRGTRKQTWMVSMDHAKAALHGHFAFEIKKAAYMAKQPVESEGPTEQYLAG